MMGKLGMYHVPHDCRHTCATLMERAKISKLHRKLILGHKIKDLTEGVYTHVSHEDLMADMIKITDMFL
jgi:integrase